MALFAIIGIEGNDPLEGAIGKEFEGKSFKVTDNHWVVVSDGTAQTVSEKLGVKDGKLGLVLVYNIAGYFGFARTPLWEWLKANGTTSGTTTTSG